MREVAGLIESGDERAARGLDVYVHRLVGYIGAYTAHLGGLDALVFTAGVGENSSLVRQQVLARLGPFGVVIDEAANQVRSKEPRAISTPGSSVAVLVVRPTRNWRWRARPWRSSTPDGPQTVREAHALV